MDRIAASERANLLASIEDTRSRLRCIDATFFLPEPDLTSRDALESCLNLLKDTYLERLRERTRDIVRDTASIHVTNTKRPELAAAPRPSESEQSPAPGSVGKADLPPLRRRGSMNLCKADLLDGTGRPLSVLRTASLNTGRRGSLGRSVSWSSDTLPHTAANSASVALLEAPRQASRAPPLSLSLSRSLSRSWSEVKARAAEVAAASRLRLRLRATSA
ncbi:hypothetical protein T484DRAFT_1803547 [Baffinella frigidus]|nr:hypothetical protein T484DRAFT_1803547 [Cryptophyta sp. CCMP2293]